MFNFHAASFSPVNKGEASTILSANSQLVLPKIPRSRKIRSWLARALIYAFACLAILPLALVFSYIIKMGLPYVTIDFVTHLPTPVGESGGGMANAIIGSFTLVLLASIIIVPIGILCGIYVAEFSTHWLARVLRFALDLMNGVPSIIIGLFIYASLVIPMQGFNAIAGAAALAMIMLPTISRTTEEILKLIPNNFREAGLALGLTRSRVLISLILRIGKGSIVTGVFLAIARAAGETAPLLFTSFNNQYWSTSLREPVASLPVQIYSYAISPYEELQRQAWAGAFVLIAFVFLVNLVSRILMQRKQY